MKKLVSLLIVLSLVMTFAVSTASAQDETINITMVMYSNASVEFFVPVVNGAKDAAALWGVNLDIQYGNDDLVTQNNLIETAIANQVDAIATIIQDDDALDDPTEPGGGFRTRDRLRALRDHRAAGGQFGDHRASRGAGRPACRRCACSGKAGRVADGCIRRNTPGSRPAKY